MSSEIIKLTKPAKISGVEVHELTMRAPKVRDMLLADKKGGGAAEREINLFAVLCEVTAEEIEELEMKDYLKLQEAYQDFLS